MKYVMFIVSKNRTTCLRENECDNINDFLNTLKEEHFGKCMNEIISQIESCIDDNWNKEIGFMSVDVDVDNTKFGVHIAEY